MSSSKNFSSKVVLITGSSSGIGAVTAVEFSRAGAQVVITGRNAEKLSKVAKECSEVSPKRLKALEVLADVSKEEDCKRLIDTTVKEFGKLDVLVNNAGAGVVSPIDDPDVLKKFDQTIDTNLRSVVYLTHLSVDHLAKTKGNIVNISSVAGLKPFPTMFAYCVSKCGLDMFTKCMALELGPKGVRVNAINPAAVKTNFPMAMGFDEKTVDSLLEMTKKSYPLGRIGESIDISSAILFLASDESSFVTGITFVSDGGALNSTTTMSKEEVNKIMSLAK